MRGSGEVHGDEAVERLRRDLLAAQSKADRSPPRRVAKALDVRRFEVAELPVFDLRVPGTTPVRTVLYLHGGGFVSGPDRLHWRYAARLARRLGVRVVVPSYPLTPRHTWKDAVPPLLELFEQLAVESAQGVVLMGDSAGGGLAVLVAQQTARRPGPQPTHLVVFAPWLDLTGRTPGTEEAAERDPWLNLSKLRIYGTWWGGEPPAPEASPLATDVSGLPPTLMFCGTRDLLHPQAVAMVAAAESAGVPMTYVEGPGLLHVYPILPIPEARAAFDRVEAFL
jgi:acetyl esterase/lipase